MTCPTASTYRDPAWWQVPLLAAISVGFESLFIHHGVNLLDEGWPLYAAMRLHEGGTLYQDVFFVFPPGHLLAAWVAYALDPPGVVTARLFYALFNVALCIAIYVLGRRLMPAPYALLGAALLAVAAPRSHGFHLLFGYRYLVFSVLALLCFSERLRSDEGRWLVAAGLLAGVAIAFRLTPAVALCAGIGLGIVASERSWRRWLADGLRFALGLLIIVGPLVVWLAATVGTETLWREAVVRPIAMTDLQSLPVPELKIPRAFDRWVIWRSFVAVQFRGFLLLYLGYAVALLFRWGRALRAGGSCDDPLLLATVAWGGIYFLRAFGRADVPHLDSAIPPICLLIAHLVRQRGPRAGRSPGLAAAIRLAGVFAAWIFLMGSALILDPAIRGNLPLASLDWAVSATPEGRALADPPVLAIRRITTPGDTILDLSASPLLHVLSQRSGVGYADLVMPGTFLSDEEELRLLSHLERSPPALVVLPIRDFDRMPSRGVSQTAPRVYRWVQERYQLGWTLRHYLLLVPRQTSERPPVVE